MKKIAAKFDKLSKAYDDRNCLDTGCRLLDFVDANSEQILKALRKMEQAKP